MKNSSPPVFYYINYSTDHRFDKDINVRIYSVFNGAKDSKKVHKEKMPPF